MKKWIKKKLENYRKLYLKREQPLTTPRQLNAEQIYLFALLGTLNVLDFFVTVIALFVAKGTIEEKNGLFAGLLADGNYLPVLIFKFCIMGFAMLFMYEKMRTAGKSYTMVRGLFMIFVTLYILIVISNILHLNFVGVILGW